MIVLFDFRPIHQRKSPNIRNACVLRTGKKDEGLRKEVARPRTVSPMRQERVPTGEVKKAGVLLACAIKTAFWALMSFFHFPIGRIE